MYGMSWMRPPEIENCVFCGKPLSGASYLMVNYPDAAHVVCARRNDIRVIIRQDLKQLRSVYKELASLLGEVEGMGKWLASSDIKGPARATPEIDNYERRKKILVQKLLELKDLLSS